MSLHGRWTVSTIGLVVLLSVPAMASVSSCSFATGSLGGPTGCTQGANSAPSITINGIADTYTGLFGADDNIQLFQVNVSGNLTLTAASFSYGGGTDLTGATITPPTTPCPSAPGTPCLGGFATQIALYNSSGGFLQNSGISTCPTFGQQGSVATGLCLDSSLTFGVNTGTYYIALTEGGIGGGNFSNGDPVFFPSTTTINVAAFDQGGAGNFTGTYGCTSGAFCDPLADQMDAAYNLDIGLGTPEPGSFGMVAAAFAVGAVVFRRRRMTAPGAR